MSTAESIIEYHRDAVAVKLPKNVRVLTDVPHLLVTSRKQDRSVCLELDPLETVWTAYHQLATGPIGKNDLLDSIIVRSGPTIRPYPGLERIVEHRLKTGASVSFAWLLLLNANGKRAICQVQDSCAFEERREFWESVVYSLEIAASE